MTKAGKKLIKAAQEAVEVAKCDHDLIVQPRQPTTAGPTLGRYYCNKCHATLYIKLSD